MTEMGHGWLDVLSPVAVNMLADRMEKPGLVTPTGLPSLDKQMFLWGDRRGIPQGSYVIVGGASNVGKTQFGLHLMKQAHRSGQQACLVSLDMKTRDVLARFQQSMVGPGIPREEWVPSRWRPEYRQKLKDALAQYQLENDAKGGISVYHGNYPGLDDVEAVIRQAVGWKIVGAGATFFVIDHLQKIRVPGVRDILERVEAVSETLDGLADELDVTIVGLSQLNRTASRETDRRPTMFDLWGGTAMESNAAIVLMLDHSRYAMDPDKHYLGRTFVLLEKNQMGPKNFEIPVIWNHAELTITEGMPDEIDEWPGARASGKKGSKR